MRRGGFNLAIPKFSSQRRAVDPESPGGLSTVALGSMQCLKQCFSFQVSEASVGAWAGTFRGQGGHLGFGRRMQGFLEFETCS